MSKRVSASCISKTLMRRRILSIVLGLLSVTTAVPLVEPVRAAERVNFNYGPLDFSISVRSLEVFAKDGTVDSDLAFLVNRLKPEQREKFRSFLSQRYQFSSTLMAQFFYSSLGERLLTYMGELIQLPADQNGLYGIRAALIQASADPEGLSAIGFMKKFPTNMRLNTKRILEQWNQISTLLKETETYVSALKQTSASVKATEPSTDFEQLPNLQNPGPYTYVKQTKMLRDGNRQRDMMALLYLPNVPEGKSVPVVVITNGIGTRIDLYDYLAQHMASHGFAIAIPQHPGSDDKQREAFLEGRASDLFESAAFVDRPQDITFLLDELERLNPTEFKNQLNLKQVGVFGNSFGGDTALAVSGAKIDFDQLEADCSPQKNLVNVSLLVQCQALELPRKDYNFRDPRIKAASVLFPGSSSLYGQSGLSQIQIPVLWGAVSKDMFSSLVLEQLPAFNALQTDDKYLVVAEGVDHLNLNFYALRTLKTMDKVEAEAVTVQAPEAAKVYLKALSLAFFQVYLADRSDYRSYLSYAYAQSISQDSYNFILLRSLNGVYSSNQEIAN
uniref:Alpha/beta hydrolase n=1 Tax=Oscillatoriales cyanobacterium SpSt-418 TaxID=2282169 RepID=A0A7C3KJ90_9CYAN